MINGMLLDLCHSYVWSRTVHKDYGVLSLSYRLGIQSDLQMLYTQRRGTIVNVRSKKNELLAV